MALRTSHLKVGDLLPPIIRTVTAEKIARLQAAGEALVAEPPAHETPAGLHTHAARAPGLARPVAPGQLSLAYLHELLARQFGPDFRQGGRLSVTFLKPVYADEAVTAHGLVTGRVEVEHRTRLTLEVWLEDRHGEKATVGEAEVTIPSPLT